MAAQHLTLDVREKPAVTALRLTQHVKDGSS